MIRKAVLDDLDRIYEIESVSFENPWRKVSLEVEFHKDYADIYVFVADGVTAAYIITWDMESEAELITLAVDPIFRGKGIGTRLLEHVLSLYEESVIWHLEVAADNEKAVSLYIKHGFENTGLIKNYYGEGRHAFRMSRFPNNY